jgi:hypothetical protein
MPEAALIITAFLNTTLPENCKLSCIIQFNGFRLGLIEQQVVAS